MSVPVTAQIGSGKRSGVPRRSGRPAWRVNLEGNGRSSQVQHASREGGIWDPVSLRAFGGALRRLCGLRRADVDRKRGRKSSQRPEKEQQLAAPAARWLDG